VDWVAPPVERVDEPFVGDERVMLAGALDFKRATFRHLCSGLTGEQLARRSMPPSTMTLLGLIRHLTDVERTWFRQRFGAEQVATYYAGEPAWTQLDPATAHRDYERLVAEQVLARRAVARLALSDTFTSSRWGQMSLRWVYLHMIGEYAGHNGHAALLREGVDGRREP
jgi:hypothetical protein